MWSKFKRGLFLILGFAALAIGFIGLFVPLLPTTPLVLSAAYLFARSSRKYHHWLRSNKYFGKTISSWEQGRGLTRREKWTMVVSATVFIGISFIICPHPIGRVVLGLVWPIPIAVAVFSRTRRE